MEQINTENTINTIKIKTRKTEDINAYMREYRLKNIEKWTTSHECTECGGKYKRSEKFNHMKTLKHKYALMELENKKLQQIKTMLS